MTIVLDTSVLFAALAFPRGLCAQLFRASLGRYKLATSAFILEELRRNLIDKTNIAEAAMTDILQILKEAGPTVIPSDINPLVCRDVNDLPILGTVAAAQADVLITGDKDLLVLGRFDDAIILSPRHFFDRFLNER